MMNNSALLVDIRPEYEKLYRKFPFKKVYSTEEQEEPFENVSVEKDTIIIIADNMGTYAKKYGEKLIEKGYFNVYYLAGGVIDWNRSGLPLEKDFSYELNGVCSCHIAPRKDRIPH